MGGSKVHRGFMGGSLGMGGMVVHRSFKCNIPHPLLSLFIAIKKKGGWGGGGGGGHPKTPN
jgi:hypothetical protein